MNPYQRSYEEIARAFYFQGSSRFLHKLSGAREVRFHGDCRDAAWLPAAEEAIWPLIYQWHYLNARSTAIDSQDGLTMREREDPGFVAQLLETDRSSGIVDPGWVIAVRLEDEYLCEKGGLRLRVHPAFLAATPRPEERETVSIRFPSGRRHWMPHYYCTGGGVTTEARFRVYFNVKPDRAAWLLGILSETLQKTGVSYQFKVLNDPRSYTRPDAAVLYLDASGLEACRILVDNIAATKGSSFSGRAPALARRLHHGIAVADEPPTVNGRRASFGEHRSRIVGRGLARAHAEGYHSVTGTVEMICREFSLEGLDSSRPYSAAGPDNVADKF